MSKIIRRQRIAKQHFKLPASAKLGTISFPVNAGPAKILSILHEQGRGAPVCKIRMLNSNEQTLVIATEGVHQNQILNFNNELSIGNCVPLKHTVEGTIVCCVERQFQDGGKIAVSSGTSCVVVAHNHETNMVTLKMPSGHKVTVSGDSRAFIGIVAGGGRVEKPLLKAGRAHYKYKSKGIYWPRVRGVAMNPVDHPHGGGNHQHVGHATTISKHAPANARVGQVAARRTGLRRGIKKVE